MWERGWTCAESALVPFITYRVFEPAQRPPPRVERPAPEDQPPPDDGAPEQ